MKIQEIPIELIDPLDPPIRKLDWEIIQDLETSIRSHGLLQPILVRPVDNRYEVVFGNHRYYAARRIEGLKTLPAIVKELGDGTSLILALVENIQRAEMNPYEEGRAYLRILGDEIHIKMLSERLGKSITYIKGRIRIFENIHPDLVNQIGEEITITNALHLSKLGKNKQLEIYMKIQERQDEIMPKYAEETRGGGGGGGGVSLYCICPRCGKKHERGIR